MIAMIIIRRLTKRLSILPSCCREALIVIVCFAGLMLDVAGQEYYDDKRETGGNKIKERTKEEK
jgi:hypothetical protein